MKRIIPVSYDSFKGKGVCILCIDVPVSQGGPTLSVLTERL